MKKSQERLWGGDASQLKEFAFMLTVGGTASKLDSDLCTLSKISAAISDGTTKVSASMLDRMPRSVVRG